jgi:hypothetical protein
MESGKRQNKRNKGKKGKKGAFTDDKVADEFQQSSDSNTQEFQS